MAAGPVIGVGEVGMGEIAMAPRPGALDERIQVSRLRGDGRAVTSGAEHLGRVRAR